MTDFENKEIHDIKKAFLKHVELSDRTFVEIRNKLDASEEERRKRHQDVMDKLGPLADTYKTATTLGKWVMAVAVFISILLGILLSLKSFIKQ